MYNGNQQQYMGQQPQMPLYCGIHKRVPLYGGRCTSCGIDVNEFITPHRELSIGARAAPIFFVLLGICGFALIFLVDISPFSIMIGAASTFAFAYMLHRNNVKVQETGIISCVHCKREMSTKTQYCIYCGEYAKLI
jgi:hypothetical protein